MAMKQRGIRRGLSLIFAAALFVGAGLGELLGDANLGWQMGIGGGLLLIASIKGWRERQWSFSIIAFALVGLYLLLQQFLPDDLEVYLAKYGYLAIGAILGSVGLGYLIQSDNQKKDITEQI